MENFRRKRYLSLVHAELVPGCYVMLKRLVKSKEAKSNVYSRLSARSPESMLRAPYLRTSESYETACIFRDSKLNCGALPVSHARAAFSWLIGSLLSRYPEVLQGLCRT